MRSATSILARRVWTPRLFQLLAGCLVPAALLGNACSSDDDESATNDAALDASKVDGGEHRDGAVDGGVRSDAALDQHSADAADAGRDVQADAATEAGVAPVDAGDAGVAADARSDARALTEAAADASDDARLDAAVDAGSSDVSVTQGPDSATPDAGTPDGASSDAATLDAGPDRGVLDSAAVAPDVTVVSEAAAGDASDSADGQSAGTPAVRYSFEDGVQGWHNDVSTDTTIGSVTTSTAQHDTGASSLAVTFTKDSDNGTVLSVDSPAGLVPGQVVTVRMFIPDNVVSWFDIYDMDANDNWSDDSFQPDDPDPFSNYTGTWHTYTHTIRAATQGDPSMPRVAPIGRMGLKIGLIGPGTIYIDSVTW